MPSTRRVRVRSRAVEWKIDADPHGAQIVPAGCSGADVGTDGWGFKAGEHRFEPDSGKLGRTRTVTAAAVAAESAALVERDARRIQPAFDACAGPELDASAGTNVAAQKTSGY